MNPKWLKIIYRPAIRKAAHQCLSGRNRHRERPELGRFTRAEVDGLLSRTWRLYDRLAPDVPREPRLGNRMNMQLACVTLACLRVLTDMGIERAYAIELIGDVAWKVYERWGRIPLFFTRLATRDAVERMRRSVSMFLRFPFTPPGYRFDLIPADDGISLDMRRCPVAEYFTGHGAPDLCVGTWCNLDFALAELWGGWLERSQTLAGGDRHCDFRFKAAGARPVGANNG